MTPTSWRPRWRRNQGQHNHAPKLSSLGSSSSGRGGGCQARDRSVSCVVGWFIRSSRAGTAGTRPHHRRWRRARSPSTSQHLLYAPTLCTLSPRIWDSEVLLVRPDFCKLSRAWRHLQWSHVYKLSGPYDEKKLNEEPMDVGRFNLDSILDASNS